jgi:hypothetical protein
MVVALTIAVIIIVTVVSMVVLEIPLPFLQK